VAIIESDSNKIGLASGGWEQVRQDVRLRSRFLNFQSFSEEDFPGAYGTGAWPPTSSSCCFITL